jgi:hypothetical protein
VAYSPELDSIIAEVTDEPTGLTVFLACYDDGPEKVRLKRRLPSGKLVDASPLRPEEVMTMIDLLEKIQQ